VSAWMYINYVCRNYHQHIVRPELWKKWWGHDCSV